MSRPSFLQLYASPGGPEYGGGTGYIQFIDDLVTLNFFIETGPREEKLVMSSYQADAKFMAQFTKSLIDKLDSVETVHRFELHGFDWSKGLMMDFTVAVSEKQLEDFISMYIYATQTLAKSLVLRSTSTLD